VTGGSSSNKCLTPLTSPFSKNAVAPAKAGAYDVCMARSTGVIGPSLRWGDGMTLPNTNSPPASGRGWGRGEPQARAATLKTDALTRRAQTIMTRQTVGRALRPKASRDL
jgi:hypothetical protein